MRRTAGSKIPAALLIFSLFWEHHGEARITWGYGEPEMVCKKAKTISEADALAVFGGWGPGL